jgi:hypothetical protein
MGLNEGTTYYFRVDATNAGGMTEGDIESFTTLPPLTVTTATLPEGHADTGYSEVLAASGGTTPYTWSVTAGSLPAGLHLDAKNGAVVGTPSVPGTSSFTGAVTDSSTPTPRIATANLSITVSAAATQAAEYGQCVAQKKGEYTEGNCQTKSEKAKKGTFEWKPGPAPSCVAVKKGFYSEAGCRIRDEKKGKPKGKFETAPGASYASTIETVTMEASGLGRTVVCADGTGTGEITGSKTGVETITFTGCEASGKACESKGSNSTPSGRAGVIVTNLLDTRLIGPISGKVLTQLVSSQHEPYLFEFICSGQVFRTMGSISGVQEGNVDVSSLTSTTTLAIGAGEQALYSELSENSGGSWAGPDATSGTTIATNTAASKTEIKT